MAGRFVYSNENLGKKTEKHRLAETVLAVQKRLFSVHLLIIKTSVRSRVVQC